MAFVYDTETGKITLPAGDTADINISVDYKELKQGDAILFAIFDKFGDRDIVIKTADLVDGKARIRICNHDTRDVEPGNYKWQLRIVTNPARGEDGAIIADDCSDNVITVFNNPPTFKITRGGAYV